MRISSYLKKIEALPFADLKGLSAGGVTIFAPHPDDEVLGTGGLIAACLDAHVPVNVVILTDGAGSHPNSRLFPRKRLVELRREECQNGLGMLGLKTGKISYLNLPDTAVPTSGPEFEHAVAFLGKYIDQNSSANLFVTWDKDPHCDHFAAARMSRAVVQARPGLSVWHYPVWGWYLPRSKQIERSAPAGFRFDITQWLERKRAALACHVSQLTHLIDDDPDGFVFPAQKLARFRGPTEYFLRSAI